MLIKTVHGIGGSINEKGVVKLKITFNGLKLVIDVDFLVLHQDIPTLMGLKDIVSNSLDISIRIKFVSHKGLTNPMELRIFFFSINGTRRI